MIDDATLNKIRSLRVEIESPTTDVQLAQIKRKYEEINWGPVMAALVRPSPGYKDHEVAGEVKQEALALATTADLRSDQAQQLEAGARAKRIENTKRFIMHIGGIDPGYIERHGRMLMGCVGPTRYQAWGKITSQHIPLWSKSSCGGDLADSEAEFCSAPDRIELIDRIGICPGRLDSSAEFALRQDGVELRGHTIDNMTTTHLPWHMLTSERGLRLIGARRPVVLPRASVPCLRLPAQAQGWIFVEGWRMILT